MAFPVHCFFYSSSISRKNVVAKRFGMFNVRKVPKSQKHAKKNIKIYYVVLKPNERESFRKSLESTKTYPDPHKTI
jgi:hypothetical protein